MPKLLKVPGYRQTPGLCGPCSLRMVFEFYGLKKSERELAKIAGATRKHGVPPTGMLKAAKAFGFKAQYQEFADLADIRSYLKKNIPVIINWFSTDEGHYSVVIGIEEKNIYLRDPEVVGIRKLNLMTFKRVWFDFPHEFLRTKNDIRIRPLIVIRK